MLSNKKSLSKDETSDKLGEQMTLDTKPDHAVNFNSTSGVISIAKYISFVN
jgi:hypothetical protein